MFPNEQLTIPKVVFRKGIPDHPYIEVFPNEYQTIPLEVFPNEYQTIPSSVP